MDNSGQTFDDSRVGAEVWGTFAVNDHCAQNAFAREVLLFDKLVIPVPADDVERNRWRHPNPTNPTESWDPDRLDRLRRLLGSQRHDADQGASLMWEVSWDANKWHYERSRSEVVDQIARFDAFYATRAILATGEDLPGVVEAVAAFPSSESCRRELQPSDERPSDASAASMLIALASPLLVPNGNEGTDFGPLRAAIELAREQTFIDARAKYYEWIRSFVARLQRQPADELGEIDVDANSFALANARLRELIYAQRKIIGKNEQRRRWTKVECAVMIVGVSANVGLALVQPVAAIGIVGQLAGFAGWIAGKRAAPPPETAALTGASMFLTVEDRLRWGGERPHGWWDHLQGGNTTRKWWDRLRFRK